MAQHRRRTPSTPSPAASPPSSTPALRRDRDRARAQGPIGKVYAGRNGIIGALTEDLIDTSKESAAAIAALRYTPSGAFGSCRYKLKSLDANRREYERLIEVFQAHDIGYFFYNGGGDSADTCFKVSQLSESDGLPDPGDPRAEDRGQRPADHRLLPRLRLGRQVRRGVGAGSVASTCARWRKTSTKVFVLEVMGRHAGWIAAAGGLDRGPRHPGRDPVPRDRRSTRRSSSRAVDALVKQHGYCTRRRLRGLPPRRRHASSPSRARKDAFGHAQLGGAAPVVADMVKHALGYKFHWAVADYLQRAARHIASKTDVEQAYAARQEAAVELAREGPQRGDADDRTRVSDKPYSLPHRRGAAGEGRERREVHAARLHHATTASASPKPASATCGR